MRLKLREIEQWMPYQKLSKDLQQEVRKHQQYIWRETKGVDVENFLNNLPKNLKRSINRELFLRFLLRVSCLIFTELLTRKSVTLYLSICKVNKIQNPENLVLGLQY